MKKAKKLGLQSLALVLMAFVLVAGVAFGMTGAWFQSNDSKANVTITMGKPVNITLDKVSGDAYGISKASGEGTQTAAMPGDTWNYSGLKVVVPADQSDMTVVIKITNSSNSAQLALTVDNGWTAFTDETLAGYYFKKITAAGDYTVIDATEFELSTELANNVANQTLTVGATAYAIQEANAGSKILVGMTKTALQAIFTQHGTEAYTI